MLRNLQGVQRSRPSGMDRLGDRVTALSHLTLLALQLKQFPIPLKAGLTSANGMLEGSQLSTILVGGLTYHHKQLRSIITVIRGLLAT